MKMRMLQASPRFWAGCGIVALLCAVLLLLGHLVAYAQSSPQEDASLDQPALKIPNGQLDSLVAPIAL
jgi:hypothetical protein